MLIDIVLVLIATTVSAYIAEKDYFAKRFRFGALTKSLIVGSVAAMMFMGSYFKEQYLVLRAHPTVLVTTAHDPVSKRVTLLIQAKKGDLRSVNIQYPFKGVINRFVDENPQKYGHASAYALPSPSSVWSYPAFVDG